jgi:hypothetical protein
MHFLQKINIDWQSQFGKPDLFLSFKDMKQALLFCILTVFAFSCKKVDEPDMRQDKLRAGNWKRTALKITYRQPGGAETTEDAYATLPACTKDDLLQFNAGSEGYVNEGGSKCNVGDPDNSKFTWRLTNGETQLNVSGAYDHFGTDEARASIITFTDNNMAIRYDIYTQTFLTTATDTVHVAAVYSRY